MATWPILYRKASSGAILMWGIETVGATIYTHHGHVGGAVLSGEDTIHEGKNLGRSNATTPETQAEAEAGARWLKQKKRGYVESEADAKAGKVDDVIEGGIAPMLAPNKSYPTNPEPIRKALVFPCFFQPKLDGMRCIAVIEDGVCSLWTRTRKPIRSVPHIIEALEKAFPEGRIILDGELYNHEYRAEFEELLSLLRGDEPDDEGRYLKAEYHVYDCPEVRAQIPNANIIGTMANPFTHRHSSLLMLSTQFPRTGPIKYVQTKTAATWEHLLELYENALVDEYEGGMARNAGAPYESGKRSKHLQKMKEFVDHEFEIIDIEEGRGKDAGTVGSFICRTKPGSYPVDEKGAPEAGTEPKEFGARLRATYARRRELFQNPNQWRGGWLTVRMKRWTAYGKPYIPIGKGIRNYE